MVCEPPSWLGSPPGGNHQVPSPGLSGSPPRKSRTFPEGSTTITCLAPWDGRKQTASTWYEPLTDRADIDLAVHWVLGREGVFLNTVGDVDLLPLVLSAAEEFSGERPSDERMNELVQRHSLTPLFI
jgi:hypothetical protein